MIYSQNQYLFQKSPIYLQWQIQDFLGSAGLVEGGGTNPRGGYVSKNLYVKMKEPRPLWGRVPAEPPGSANDLSTERET